MLRRSPFTLLAALVVALVFWWFQTGDDPGSSPSAERDAVGTNVPSAQRGPATIGPVEEPSGGRGQQAPPEDDVAALPTVRLVDLPPEAAEVVRRIDAGGPFAYPDRDGSRFGNYEQLLPLRPRTYYREYTVPTPGLDHRGARRLVRGGAGELYWTADHYATFARVLR